jgi:hypothetical protein
MIFKYDDLKLFYSKINRLGITSRFRDWAGEKVFLIRHDVDFSIDLALRMAKVENESKIVSTYFIMTSCESYNVLTEKSRKQLKEIINLGHEIGLHFDPTIYKDNLVQNVKKEVEILSFIIQEEVKSISLHNPSLHGQYPLFDFLINAYDPRLFSDSNYISDSCYDFRGKNPFEFIEGIDKSMIQVLLHPMHYSEEGDGYDKVIPRTLLDNINIVHNNFSVNKTYSSQVGESLHGYINALLS